MAPLPHLRVGCFLPRRVASPARASPLEFAAALPAQTVHTVVPRARFQPLSITQQGLGPLVRGAKGKEG